MPRTRPLEFAHAPQKPTFTAPSPRTAGNYSVVIPCHNYGRYLADAIVSVLNQTIPAAEIIVVDDCSTDNTKEVAESYASKGVQYVRVDYKNVYNVRKHGYLNTTKEFLIFLDADDYIATDYFEKSLEKFADPSVGIAYTDLTDFDENGLTGKMRRYPALNMECQNYIHSGSVVRRVAIDQADAFGYEDLVLNERADWFVWKRVMRGGWKAAKYEAVYYYRQHPLGCHLNEYDRFTYYQMATIDAETVTIVLPLSGRERFLPQLFGWVTLQKWERYEVLVIDSSNDANFGKLVRKWLASLDCSHTYLSIPGISGLADANRYQHEHFLAVQRIMPRIYKNMDRLITEFNMVVEEDVLPPLDAIPRLLQSMNADIAAVSGVYRSRWTKENLLVWGKQMEQYGTARSGVEEVGGSGFGCLLIRRSAINKVVCHAGGATGNFDPNAANDIRALGWRWLCDWSVQCEHDGVRV